jgi:molybdate/tungstate transport system substrate-binding protein
MKVGAQAIAVALSLILVGCGGTSHTSNVTAVPAASATQPVSQATSATASPTAPAAASAAPAALTNAPAPSKGSGAVQVLYAGSLVSLMENQIRPAFNTATGYEFQGEGKGSVALANEIKDKLRQADVFISADPTVNDTLAGAKNGDLADWYVVWGRTTIVIAYNPKSRFAPQLAQAKAGAIPWYTVLEMPGFRLGRTDPQTDPKGYRTLWMFDLAEKFYKQPGLKRTILGADDNTAQIFPEEELVARMQSGQLDAGIFYLSEVTSLNPPLPFVSLPGEINQGDPALAKHYSQETYTNKMGQSFTGSPILYTATVPSVSKNPAGGLAFVQYLATAAAREMLQTNGILPTNLLSGGDASKIPSQLQPFVTGSYSP